LPIWWTLHFACYQFSWIRFPGNHHCIIQHVHIP
jgi:hypothetical protein